MPRTRPSWLRPGLSILSQLPQPEAGFGPRGAGAVLSILSQLLPLPLPLPVNPAVDRFQFFPSCFRGRACVVLVTGYRAQSFQFFPSCFKLMNLCAYEGAEYLPLTFNSFPVASHRLRRPLPHAPPNRQALSILSQLPPVFERPLLCPLHWRTFNSFPVASGRALRGDPRLWKAVPILLSILSQLPHRRLHLGPGEDHPAALSILSQLPQRASELSSLPHLAR